MTAHHKITLAGPVIAAPSSRLIWTRPSDEPWRQSVVAKSVLPPTPPRFDAYARTETEYRDMMLADARRMANPPRLPPTTNAEHNEQYILDVAAIRSNRIRLVTELLNQAPATREDVMSAIGMGRDTAIRFLQFMEGEGLVTQSRHGIGGKKFWAIAARSTHNTKEAP